MEIEITQLTPSQWQVYKKIQLEALKNDPQSFGSSYKDWVTYSDKKWQERPSNPDSMIFIAKDGDTPVGLLGVYMHAKDGQKIADLWGMYVNNIYRRKGIGKQLMHKALDAIHHKKEIKKVTLMVNEQEFPAIKLYEALGFKKTGNTDYILGDGKKYLLYIMEKSL